MFVADVFHACEILQSYFGGRHELSIALASKVMDIRASNPDSPISRLRGSGTKLDFVRVVGQLLIEAAALLPETPACEEREPSYPR